MTLTVKEFAQKPAREWFEKYHYTGSIGNSQVGRFAVFEEDAETPVGMVSVGMATNVHGLSKKFELDAYRGNIEISRVAMHPSSQDRLCRECGALVESGDDVRKRLQSDEEDRSAPSCTEHPEAGASTRVSTSKVVGAVLRELGKPGSKRGYEWVFSYADSGQEHVGGIYQALNAHYVGLSAGAVLFFADGERLHNRIIAERYGTTRWPHPKGTNCPGTKCDERRCPGRMAARDGIDLQKDWEGSSDKFTYLLVCAESKKDRAALNKLLRKFDLPYPKLDAAGRIIREHAGGARETSLGSTEESQGQFLVPAPSSPVTPQHLYPFQKAAAAFLATAGAALVGDEMGTGKTPTAIRAVQLIQHLNGNWMLPFLARPTSPLPLLIVCPAGVKRTWKKQLAKWWPGARVTVADAGLAHALEAVADVAEGRADILVVNYEILPKLSRLAPYGNLRIERCVNCDPTSTKKAASCQYEPKALNETPFATVIADEAHRVKDPTTTWARALWAVGDRAEYRFALTGTPIANSPADLWAVMRFVAPAEFPAKTQWVKRYCSTELNVHSGFPEAVGLKPETRAEFERFFLPRFIRRPKAAVLPDLPPKTYVRREVELNSKMRKAYNSFRDTLVAQVDNGTLFATNPLQETLRLKQLASAFGEMKVRPDGSVRYTLSEPSTKLDEIVAKGSPGPLLEELGPDRQAVIFAESAQLIRLLATRFDEANEKAAKAGTLSAPFPYALLIGGQSDAERDAYCEAFEDGKARYMLATVGAGGEGIDGLQVADTAVFLQRPWSAVLSKQAEDRLHREGQKSENVTVIDVVADDTVEDHVLATLRAKAGKLEDLVNDAETLRRWFG